MRREGAGPLPGRTRGEKYEEKIDKPRTAPGRRSGGPGLIAQVAGTAAEAIEELAERKQDAAAAVTMEQVAAAIESAVTAAMEEAY